MERRQLNSTSWRICFGKLRRDGNWFCDRSGGGKVLRKVSGRDMTPPVRSLVRPIREQHQSVIKLATCQIQTNKDFVSNFDSYICLATINVPLKFLKTLHWFRHMYPKTLQWFRFFFEPYTYSQYKSNLNQTPSFHLYEAHGFAHRIHPGGGTAAAETRQRGECQAHADRLWRIERHSRGHGTWSGRVLWGFGNFNFGFHGHFHGDFDMILYGDSGWVWMSLWEVIQDHGMNWYELHVIQKKK